MMASERIDAIVNILRERRIVNAQELASRFDVSIVTIRRDLERIVNSGIAKRIYGGAVLAEAQNINEETPGKFSRRSERFEREKAAIARKAADLVCERDAIFLDIGTTVAELAKCLVDRRNITVVTNSLAVMNILSNSSVTVYCIGGQLRGGQDSLYGDMASSNLRRFNIDRAFMGVGGVTLDDGVTYFFPDNAEIERTIVSSSRERILLTDSSKFGIRRLSKAFELKSVNKIITDNGVSQEYRNGIGDLGIDLITVDP